MNIGLEKGDIVTINSDKEDFNIGLWYVLDFVDTWPEGVIVYSDEYEDVRFVPTWNVERNS